MLYCFVDCGVYGYFVQKGNLIDRTAQYVTNLGLDLALSCAGFIDAVVKQRNILHDTKENG